MKKILVGLFTLWACAAQAQIVGTLPFQLQNGTTADATQVMADFNKILNDVNINAAKNGVNTDITALNALVTPITPVQGGTTIYFASTSAGTANAQTVASPSPVGFTLSVGKRVTFLAGFTNTGAMQLNVNGTGLTNVFRPTPAGPIALTGGEVVVNNYIEAVFDGTQYQLYTDATQKGGFGPLTTLASAGTTDLGTIPSHNISISGAVTITAFGSTAVVTYPAYKIRFVTALTLTHNGTSLILPGGANIVTAANDSADVQYLGSGNWIVTNYSKANGAAAATVVPTRCVMLSTAATTCSNGGTQANNGTYTTPANVRWIRIRAVGGGGGGAGSGTSGAGTGGTGGNTTFSTLTASGGVGGVGGSAAANNGGAGGAATGGYLNYAGANGGSVLAQGATLNLGGFGGGSSFFGGQTGAPLLVVANTGAGGSGGNQSTTAAGSGGGGGGSVEHIIGPPAASYSYTVGAPGTAGTVGSGGSPNAGTAGAAGVIIVEEFY